VRAACAAALLMSACSGCYHFRGIPSHGGGKRFDEEQRVVAGAVRRTVSSMDIAELRGKKTGLVITHTYTSGSGTTIWSGLQDVSLGLNRSSADTHLERTSQPGAGFRDETDDDRDATNLGLRYRPFSSYRAANHRTEGDLQYFRAALEMKARHQGLSVVVRKPEALLHVLVDVLGTNRSRHDFLIYSRDELAASCEVTYYAQDTKTGELIFKARQTGSTARYREGRVFFVPRCAIRRSIAYSKPVYFDTEEPRPRNGSGAEVPEDLAEVRRASRHMTTRQREKLLEALRDRAKFYIEAGNLEEAGQHVEVISEVDPGYRGLPDLAADIAEFRAGSDAD
jgi:hypothetical protein